MDKALELAKEAFQQGEVPVAALIVDSTSNDIIASYYNQVEARGQAIAHAELLALQYAFEHQADKHNTRLEYCDMYVTLEPCPMCAQAISLARIRRLYFAAYDIKGGGVVNGPQLYEQPTCFHKPQVIAGIMENEAKALMQAFFLEKRD